MKLLFAFLISISCNFFAQRLQIVSVKDSLPVSFASVLIKSDQMRQGGTSNDSGFFEFNLDVKDTDVYVVSVRGFGFKNYEKIISGIELRKINTIYLGPENLTLEEVVITAQYEPTLAEKSVQKIKVIDKEKIRQMGAVNLRDVLSNQLNVRLQQDNILGSGMSLQGLTGENVKILMDGVPMIGRLNGNIDLSQININNVERIEFIEGPLSVQYGTNALAGTVNIITRKTMRKKRELELSSYYESIGTYNITGDAGFSHKKHSFQLSGGRNYFDGWSSSDALFRLPVSRIADSARFKQWKPKEQYFGNAAYNYPFKKMDLGLKSAYFDELIINRGYPRAPYSENTFDDYYFTRRADNSLSLKGSLFEKWSINALTAFNYYQRIKKTVYKDLTTLEETVSANSSDQDTSRFTLWMSRASFVRSTGSSKLNYELGYDVNYESALGKRLDKQLQQMGDYAVFVTSEYKPYSKLTLKPGLRYAYNTVYETPLVPSLNVKWNPGISHTLRASYARGFRAPSIKELYFLFVDVNHNIVGNTRLTAEQSDNYALAYTHTGNKTSYRIKTDVSFFYNHIFNLISLAQTTGTEYSYVNIGEYKTLGVQLANSLSFKSLVFQTGFNYTGRYNDLSANKNLPRFNYSPEVSANITYKIVRWKTNISVFYKYNGALPGYAIVNDEIVETSLASYQIMDATLSSSFCKERIHLTLGCKNIMDVRNINTTLSGGTVHGSSSTNIPLSTGRNYFLKLGFRINKG